MNAPDNDVQHPALAWDAYWQGTQENTEPHRGGPKGQSLRAFWLSLFTAERERVMSPRLLDLVCGDGAVSEFAGQVWAGAGIVALDYSFSAVSQVLQSQRVHAVVADAGRPVLAEASMDIIASQFGVEYPGASALAAYAPVLRPGGTLAAIMHLRDGSIHRECQENLQVCAEIISSQVFPLACNVFMAVFDLNQGKISVADFRKAEQEFQPALRVLESMLRGSADEAAHALPQRIYADIASMYKRMSTYDRSDVSTWLDGMEAHVDAYSRRMASMISAGLDEQEWIQIQGDLGSAGLSIERCDQLQMGSDTVAGAWVLVARKP